MLAEWKAKDLQMDVDLQTLNSKISKLLATKANLSNERDSESKVHKECFMPMNAFDSGGYASGNRENPEMGSMVEELRQENESLRTEIDEFKHENALLKRSVKGTISEWKEKMLNMGAEVKSLISQLEEASLLNSELENENNDLATTIRKLEEGNVKQNADENEVKLELEIKNLREINQNIRNEIQECKWQLENSKKENDRLSQKLLKSFDENDEFARQIEAITKESKSEIKNSITENEKLKNDIKEMKEEIKKMLAMKKGKERILRVEELQLIEICEDDESNVGDVDSMRNQIEEYRLKIREMEEINLGVTKVMADLKKKEESLLQEKRLLEESMVEMEARVCDYETIGRGYREMKQREEVYEMEIYRLRSENVQIKESASMMMMTNRVRRMF